MFISQKGQRGESMYVNSLTFTSTALVHVCLEEFFICRKASKAERNKVTSSFVLLGPRRPDHGSWESQWSNSSRIFSPAFLPSELKWIFTVGASNCPGLASLIAPLSLYLMIEEKHLISGQLRQLLSCSFPTWVHIVSVLPESWASLQEAFQIHQTISDSAVETATFQCGERLKFLRRKSILIPYRLEEKVG